MGSLDSYKEDFIAHLLDGSWKALFPTNTWNDLYAWFQRQKAEKSLCVRFTFYDPDYKYEKYAIHLICSPILKKTKVQVKNLYLPPDENALGLPPNLYDFPLYSAPGDLLQSSLNKHRKKKK